MARLRGRVRLGRTRTMNDRRRVGDKKFKVKLESNIGGGSGSTVARDPVEAASKMAVTKMLRPRNGLRRKTIIARVVNVKSGKETTVFG